MRRCGEGLGNSGHGSWNSGKTNMPLRDGWGIQLPPSASSSAPGTICNGISVPCDDDEDDSDDSNDDSSGSDDESAEEGSNSGSNY